LDKKKIRVSVGALGAVAGLLWSVPLGAQVPRAEQAPVQVCDDPSDSISLFAERIGKGRIGYGTEPGKASIPGPTLEMTEGECLQVTLVNDTDKRLSMHAHGVSYTVASDGTPLNKSCVRPGRSRTYVFEAQMPGTRADGTIDPGSAGYWHYHDHCMGTPHGTGGVKAGLFGALIVRRQGDPVPDRPPVVLVMQGSTFNLKRAPKTPMPEANEGERVEFVVIGHGELFHTFHLHGHRWSDTRNGLLTQPTDAARTVDNKTVGPADSFGFQVIAGEGVGPGAWMYHCHVQSHSDAGMEGLFIVNTPGGTRTQPARDAIRAFRSQHGDGHVH
jgi:FtsP/CotA-like multicopper oxidase with cupredoxin domain